MKKIFSSFGQGFLYIVGFIWVIIVFPQYLLSEQDEASSWHRKITVIYNIYFSALILWLLMLSGYFLTPQSQPKPIEFITLVLIYLGLGFIFATTMYIDMIVSNRKHKEFKGEVHHWA